ncbi:MAG TPA: hypothetical protein HA254_04940 [Candidatus Diapherotrites archaeon]|uniref:Uncharacterized protein n=1 Tax=Candidatus Iainarchaeum sp. TaxID=3101447 RepID=A0A7J4J0U3_9ARCH|nr:hypothetical protein [Candidatus Diapherotrites archaeon]
MSTAYHINFIIEKKQFNRVLCSKIAYSLLTAHKDELGTEHIRNNKIPAVFLKQTPSGIREQMEKEIEAAVYSPHKDLKAWLENEIDLFYSGRNGEGLASVYGGASVWKVYDRPDKVEVTSLGHKIADTLKSWGYNIPIDKAVIVMGLGLNEIFWADDCHETEYQRRIAKNINNLVKDAITIYNAIHPIAGACSSDNDPSIITTIPTNAEHITWLNFFGPELTKKFGREKLLSAPTYKIVEFSDGGMLLMSGPTPFGNKKSEYFDEWNTIECQDKIAKHLGLRK